MIETMTTNTQELVETIRSKVDLRLHYCRNCSQGIRLVQEIQPYLDSLKASDFTIYAKECNRLADGLIPFIDSFVKTTVLKYEPDYYLNDFGLSEVTDNLRDAESLISYLFHIDISAYHKMTLNTYLESIDDIIRSAKTSRKSILRIRRRNRIRYYLDGPVIVGLIALVIIVIMAIIKMIA